MTLPDGSGVRRTAHVASMRSADATIPSTPPTPGPSRRSDRVKAKQETVREARKGARNKNNEQEREVVQSVYEAHAGSSKPSFKNVVPIAGGDDAPELDVDGYEEDSDMPRGSKEIVKTKAHDVRGDDDLGPDIDGDDEHDEIEDIGTRIGSSSTKSTMATTLARNARLLRQNVATNRTDEEMEYLGPRISSNSAKRGKAKTSAKRTMVDSDDDYNPNSKKRIKVKAGTKTGVEKKRGHRKKTKRELKEEEEKLKSLMEQEARALAEKEREDEGPPVDRCWKEGQNVEIFDLPVEVSQWPVWSSCRRCILLISQADSGF